MTTTTMKYNTAHWVTIHNSRSTGSPPTIRAKLISGKEKREFFPTFESLRKTSPSSRWTFPQSICLALPTCSQCESIDLMERRPEREKAEF